MLADGGVAIGDLAVLRDQPNGAVPCTSALVGCTSRP
jgi:hypothetical protein